VLCSILGFVWWAPSAMCAARAQPGCSVAMHKTVCASDYCHSFIHVTPVAEAVLPQDQHCMNRVFRQC
jgi:hypothetical protein